MIIYKITNTVNGKIYIGQTVQTLLDRWSDHCRPCRGRHVNRSAIASAIRKYGKENFSIEEVDRAQTLDELNIKEQTYIKALKCLAPDGYNLELGGKSKTCHSETRLKISATLKGRPFTNRWTKGNLKPHSEETRAKISATMTGAPQPWKHKKVMCVETGQIWESVNAASLATGIKRPTLSVQLKSGGKNRATGFTFRFV